MLATRPISAFTVVCVAAGFLEPADYQVYPASLTSPTEHDFRAHASLQRENAVNQRKFNHNTPIRTFSTNVN